MADNVSMVDDLLEVEIPAPERSWFDRSHITRFSCSAGYGYPVAVMEILPNSTVDMDLDILTKSSATTNSVYGTLRQSVQAFFVPSRIYCKKLDQNMLNGVTNTPADLVQFPVIRQDAYRGTSSDLPLISPSAGQSSSISTTWCVPAGGVLEMLGYYPPNYPISKLSSVNDCSNFNVENLAPPLNAIPWLGYWDIFRNYYYNRQDPQVPFVFGEQISSVDTVVYDGEFFDVMFDKVYSQTVDDEPFVFDMDGAPYNILTNYQCGALFRLGISRYTFAFAFGLNDDPQIYTHAGYWRRTYDDDYFVSRLSPDYISALDSSARVVVSSNGFSIQQFRLANRNDRYTNRNIHGGTRYDDWLDVHYGAKLNRELNIPQFLGSVSAQFYFDDIYATAGTAPTVGDFSPTSVGERAATLNTSMRVNQFAKFTSEEHGYLMVIYTIVPRVDYYGGTPKMFFKTSLADVYKPEYDAVGYQSLLLGELKGPGVDALDECGNQIAWFEYMVDYNKLHGDFAVVTDDVYGRNYFTISRDTSLASSYSSDGILSTYVEGWNVNKIFKETACWKDNFDVQIHLNCRVGQPMSKQIVPRL